MKELCVVNTKAKLSFYTLGDLPGKGLPELVVPALINTDEPINRFYSDPFPRIGFWDINKLNAYRKS